MLVLTEPMRAEAASRRSSRGRPAVSAAISIGSPTACRCRAPRRSRSCRRRRRRPPAPRRSPRPGRRRSARGSRPCAAPSLLTAEPLITAWIVVAVGERVLEPPQHHDARAAAEAPCPGARSSKARQWPSGERISPSSVEVAAAVRQLDRRRRRRAPCRTRRASRLWQAEVHGDERGRARGLHADARAAQVEHVGDARGEEVLVVAGVAQQEQADDCRRSSGLRAAGCSRSRRSCRSRRRRRSRRRSVSGAWPASSSASQAHSRKRRCCGSRIAGVLAG